MRSRSGLSPGDCAHFVSIILWLHLREMPPLPEANGAAQCSAFVGQALVHS